MGTSTGRHKEAAGIPLAEIHWLASGSVRFEPEELLESLPDRPLTLDDDVRLCRFGPVEDLRRLMTWKKLNSGSTDLLYSMRAAKIDFLEYQFKPVLKLIESPHERLLIADEVGLGKTIESALIWLELMARYDARRLLVVCTKMLLSKWRRELRTKFDLSPEVLNREQFAQGVREAEREGDGCGFCWITSYTALRPDREDMARIEEPGEEVSAKGAILRRLLELSESSGRGEFFDLVVFDESHYMRNRATATAALGSVLSRCTKRLLCVSATPIQNRAADLFSILQMLDPDNFQNIPQFETLVAHNEPAIRAKNALQKVPPEPAAALEALERLRQSPFVGDLPILGRAIEQVSRLAPGDRAGILSAQALLDELDLLGAYICRTRRRQVAVGRPLREAVAIPVALNEEEQQFYWAVTRAVRLRVQRDNKAFSFFHLITPQLRMASSIPAMVDAYRRGEFTDLEVLIESGVMDEDSEEAVPSGAVPTDDILSDLPENLRTYDYEANDSKYNALRQYILNELGGRKAVIFSFFRNTLLYLVRRLAADDIRCACMHGGVDEAGRDKAMEDFEAPDGAQILLTSEVGSEGIDLQFANIVVNYDLPWNPMRVEQRIGRVDRVGQEAKKVFIVSFRVENTIEERVYTRLHQKLQVFESIIGDVEDVLGEEIRKLTRMLLGEQLTADQEAQLIEQTELAVERKLADARNLDEQAETLAAHRDLIIDRIGLSRKLSRCITPQELTRYVEDFFRHRHRECRLEWGVPTEGLMTIRLTREAYDALRGFADAKRVDLPVFDPDRTAIVTFDSDLARKHERRLRGRLWLANHLSPFIRWINQENQTEERRLHPLAAVAVKTPHIPPGLYGFRLRIWTLDGLRSQKSLVFAAATLDGCGLLSAIDAERLLLEATERGRTLENPVFTQVDWLAAQEGLTADLDVRFEAACEEFKARNDTLLQIQKKRVDVFFARRIEADQRRAATLRTNARPTRVISMTEDRIRKNERLARERIEGLNRSSRFQPGFEEVAAGLILVKT